MKKRLSLICGLLAVSTTLYSNESYISTHFGGNVANSSDVVSQNNSSKITFDFGGSFLIAYGVKFLRPNMRTEIEFAYQKSDIEKINNQIVSRGFVSSASLMVNEYYDFYNDTLFTPYVTAGIGFAKVELDDFDFDKYKGSDKVFAYQFGTGVEYKYSDQISLDARYRFYGTDNSEFANSTCQYSLHSILFGMRVDF